MKHAKRHPLIFGTIILTATGLITRVIGFFYRIYLSRLFGEEGMGIYQLLSPALSLSFSFTAAGFIQRRYGWKWGIRNMWRRIVPNALPGI